MPADDPQDSYGSQQVEITVVVVPGRIRTLVARLFARQRVRVALVVAAVLVVLAGAGAVIAVTSSSTKPAGPSLGSQGLAVDAHVKGLDEAVFKRFGIQWECPRVTAVARGGAYVRVDFEHTGPCGVYGNTVALVLHRVRGVWWPKFEASVWTCPISALPAGVGTELGLCRRSVGPPR